MDPQSQRARWKSHLERIPAERREETRNREVWEHIESTDTVPSIPESYAVQRAHHMSPDAFKSDIDEIAAFSRLRNALCELDDLLGIAAVLRVELKGLYVLNVVPCFTYGGGGHLLTWIAPTGKITEAYPAYLERHIDKVLRRVVSATADLQSTTQFLRRSLIDDCEATDGRADEIAQLNSFSNVWQLEEAVKEALGDWKPDADAEWKRLRGQLCNIWMVAAEKEPDMRAYLGWQGV
ncbi:MAG: hypothetical protein Q9203_005384 [Teloschistes exilis]